MAIDVNIMEKCRIEMNAFDLNWRFVSENYNPLPPEVLTQLVPLDACGAKYLNEILVENGVHANFPFKEGLFENLKSHNMCNAHDIDTKNWLSQLGMNQHRDVYLSWSGQCAMITSWGIVINYYDDLFYTGSDDLTVFDSSLDWALLFFHESQIYFGTRK